MDPAQAAQRLARLREIRGPKPRPSGEMSGFFQGVRRELARTEKKLGGVGAAWADRCPGHLVERTAVKGVSRGVLTIAATDPAVRWELERALKGGLARDVIAASPMTVRRIKVVVDAQP